MMLQTRNLTLKYPDKLLCHDLNLTVNPGECWAILGRNGCGKTTLIHALGGLRQANGNGGSPISLGGKLLESWSRRDLARHLGILLQEEPGEFWGDVREYVLLGRHPYADTLFGWRSADLDIALEAIERMELADVAHRPLGTLSGGERQRARIALLLAQSPQYYLLDEPLQHLDLRHQLGVMQLFKELGEQGSALMMVLHDIGWASRFCDHVLMIFENGQIIAGGAEDLLNRENLEALYQCSMEEFVREPRRHTLPGSVSSV
ncbi:MAG: ABC transporter [Nitrosospira sp. 56-18]|nr:ABC transporter ATP-binding protein [Nitrosospira sp.]OJY14542.1 MAG: ABC transporter [Nitrosospira sp. 56-18]